MKMLLFDFRSTEADYFKNNDVKDFSIKFINEPLNEFTELTEEEFEDTDIISVFTTSNLNETVLSKFKNLRMITTRSTAYSHIDLNYCNSHNIAVSNVEDYGKTSVAEYAITLVLMLVRKIMPAYYDMKRHTIEYQKYEGKNLSDLKLGIIGCGAIGSAVAKIAHFFGMQVLICSYMKNPDLADLCSFVSIEKLLKESDVITLHLPYDGENYHMLSYDEFDMMKDGVFVVNTSRGELINIEALYKNLVSKKISGAALDVLECEYLSTHATENLTRAQEEDLKCVRTALVTQKLFNMENVVITPHIAYNTTQSVNYLLETSFNNVRDYLKGMYTNRVC